ncbi:MAG: electron transfer flavoprotein subunit alpha/FixB family protein [Methanobacteriota archaeon]
MASRAGREPVETTTTRERLVSRGKEEFRDILVVAETDGGKVRNATLEVLGAARSLADNMGARVEVLLLGEGVEPLAEGLIKLGADVVHVGESEGLSSDDLYAFFDPVLSFVKRRRPEIILMSATPLGLDVAPMLAAALNTGVANDCFRISFDPVDNLMVCKGYLYGGSVEANVRMPYHRPQIATLRPGAGSPPFPDEMRYGRVEPADVRPALGRRARLVAVEDVPAKRDLSTAEAVVCVGQGGSREEAEALARRLGAEVGATRPLVQAGLFPPGRHVGVEGARVAPRLYVGLGVSGAFEHYLGIHEAQTIVAVNTDPDAPIFRYAHYGIVAPAEDVVPAILEALEGRAPKRR